jgi:hypothetical protein
MIRPPSVAWLRGHSTRELHLTDEQRMTRIWNRRPDAETRSDLQERPPAPDDDTDRGDTHA